MPLPHDDIRTTVETYLARHPHERPQLGGLLKALNRHTDIASRRLCESCTRRPVGDA